jgi:hypothetical protein
MLVEQVAWPHSQAISTSPDPASLQDSLQYFWPLSTTQVQGTWAQVFFSGVVISFAPFTGNEKNVAIIAPHNVRK